MARIGPQRHKKKKYRYIFFSHNPLPASQISSSKARSRPCMTNRNSMVFTLTGMWVLTPFRPSASHSKYRNKHPPYLLYIHSVMTWLIMVNRSSPLQGNIMVNRSSSLQGNIMVNRNSPLQGNIMVKRDSLNM